MLDQGPPPPPGVSAPAPPASMGALAGPQQGQAGQPDQSVQKSVLEKMMVAEKAMQDAATVMPSLAPVISDLISQFRSRVGAIVLQGQQQGDSQAGGMSSLLSGGSPSPATS